jgi:hypothetical protein
LNPWKKADVADEGYHTARNETITLGVFTLYTYYHMLPLACSRFVMFKNLFQHAGPFNEIKRSAFPKARLTPTARMSFF